MLLINLLAPSVALASPCPYAALARRAETNFTNQTAAAQLTQVWSSIVNSAAAPTSFTYSTLELLWESMGPTVNTESDQLPNGRTKAVHSAGAVAQAKFVAVPGNPYTGLFQGADSALVRFSLASQPDSGSNQIVPGAAMKMFRDNSHSANMFFMIGIAGQSDYNFFASNFSNHISSQEGGPAGLVAGAKFATAPSYWPAFTGLSGVSDHDALGNPIARPVYPFQVVMQPTTEAHELFAQSFSSYDATDAYVSLKALQSIPAGTPLWKVWAAPSPDNLVFNQIGTIVQTSTAVLNAYGNEGLFFRHQVFDQDVADGTHGVAWKATCPDVFSCINCAAPAINNCIFESSL